MGPSWRSCRRGRLRAAPRRARPLVERRHRRHRARRALASAITTSRGNRRGCGRCSPTAGSECTTMSSSGCARSSAREPRAYTKSGPYSPSCAPGVALAICSNWDWDLHEAIEPSGSPERSTWSISSAWVGAEAAPPHLRAHAGSARPRPDDALFVGDTWTCDVDGPRAAGMRPIYLRRRASRRRPHATRGRRRHRRHPSR